MSPSWRNRWFEPQIFYDIKSIAILETTCGLRLVNITMTASLLVLLAGDVSSNPGPTHTNAGKLLGKRGFRFAHLNAHSIVNKMDEIRLLLRDNPFEVFAVSEARLNSSILDSEVSVPGYTLVRNDRNVKRGGGTVIYVKDGVSFKQRIYLSSETFETLWIEIMRPKCKL